ncbi:MAG: branched-chain amino acid ABC transporter permease [Anaerolineales bacterium]|nr:branched-chain amino acid ABC transporter permease [Anaerolineales bacterium]
MTSSTTNIEDAPLKKAWPQWWPYLAVLAFLILFPFLAGLTIGDPSAVEPGAGWLTAVAQRTESGYAKFWQGMLIQIFIWGIFALSYDLLLGFTGILSFGHAMFFGTGAYAVAILIDKHVSWPLGWALAAVILISLMQSIIFGVLSLRVKGVYLAMVTLAFAEMFFILSEAGDFRKYTGADDGLHGFPVPDYLSAADHRTRFYYLALIFFVIVFLAARRLVNSPPGRVMIATRDNEHRATTIGFDTFRYKLIAFVAAGVFAGLAGALSALYNVSITPALLSTDRTIDVLAMTIIGGVGTLVGPITGAVIVQLLGYWLERWFGSSWTLIYGIIFMLIVVFLPYGIIGTLRARSLRLKEGWGRWLKLLGIKSEGDAAFASHTEMDNGDQPPGQS